MKPEPLTPVEVVRIHNKWRRGDESLTLQRPEAIGEALDAVCDAIENHAAEILGWENKWQCAVDMAARAQIERDELLTALCAYRYAKGRYHTQKACDRLIALIPDTFRPVE